MGVPACLVHFAIGVILNTEFVHSKNAGLYPQDSETRDIRSLDGIWDFIKSDHVDPMQGVIDKWYQESISKVKPPIPMPVPSSYNDITTDESLRDHVGAVWYERIFFTPRSWELGQRVWIRFGSVHYRASVWINGYLVVQHEIGSLPFEAEITDVVKWGNQNRVTVMCDNSLNDTTVPQGTASDGKQWYSFEFFNYAGIHRSVHLYTTPNSYIYNIEVTTDFNSLANTGSVSYRITSNGTSKVESPYVQVQLFDKEGAIVASDISQADLMGTLIVPQPRPWWPYLMSTDPGYLYSMEVALHEDMLTILDVYRLKVGLRRLVWDNSSLTINGRPIYFRGFGKHEDSDIRGKGFDYATLVRDFNLLKWVGANAYRTSHYPYSEESMQLADEEGIMIVDECPSANTEIFSADLLHQHKSAIQQMIHRDRNHVSVIIWSVSNEPTGEANGADVYFESVASFARALDFTRPVTAAITSSSSFDKISQHLDIISFNRYNGWYTNPGELNMIFAPVIEEAETWHTLYNKPVMITEYGADTIEGLHFLPSYVWSEEYQADLLAYHFRAFDALRLNSWFIGEFVWNFADFMTAQSEKRVGGNRKGVFTRNRQPKYAAQLLRRRYFMLGKDIDQSELPMDLFTYVTDECRI